MREGATVQAALTEESYSSGTSSSHGKIGTDALLRLNLVSVRRLASPGMRRALALVLAARCRRDRWASKALVDIHDFIGYTPDVRARRAAIALKRDVYNGRAPDSPAFLVSSIGSMAVVKWREAQAIYTARRVKVHERYEGDLAEERDLLAELVGNEDFCAALALLAPQVYTAADRYAKHRGSFDNRDRKSERGLVQYLTRAFYRTSPSSRFTAVGRASWQRDGPHLDDVAHASVYTSRFTLDQPMLGYLIGGLAEKAATSTWVMASVTLRVGGDTVEFSRPENGLVRVLSAPLTGRLRLLLAFAELGPYREDRLVVDLCEASGLAPREVKAYVSAALRAGILTRAAFGDEQLPDQLEAAAAQFDREPAGAAGVLGVLRSRVGALAGASAVERSRLVRLVGESGDALAALSGRYAELHVFEDTSLRFRSPSTAGYEEPLRDMASALEFLSFFDRMHDVRALTAAVIVEMFGAGANISLVPHGQAIVDEVYRRSALLGTETDRELGPSDGSLAELIRQRQRAVDHLVSTVLRQRSEAELTWDRQLLRELGAMLPARFRRTPLSYSVLVQPIEGRLVLNDVYTGHGALFSRFISSSDSAARMRLRRRLEGLYGADDVVLWEDRGLHRANVNAHAQILSNAMDPHAWARMRLVHHPESDEVSLADPSGKTCRVLHLGAQFSELLPYPLRLAYWLTGSGRLVFTIPQDVYTRTSSDGQRPRMLQLPRMRVGSVVLARQRWFLGDQIPSPRTGAHDVDYLLDVSAWRADHGIPDQVFAKTPLVLRDPAAQIQNDSRWLSFLATRKATKPQYLDLSSALMTRMMPRLLARRGETYLEEVLPQCRDGAHALEWMIEYDRAANGTFDSATDDLWERP